MLPLRVGGSMLMSCISNITISADIYCHANASVDLQLWQRG